MGVCRVDVGAGDSSIILHVPHASRRLTEAARRRILLDDAALARELDRMTDADTDLLAARAAARAARTPWVCTNLYSRLVVDPERFPDEREEMIVAGMGAVYTRTSDGEPLREPDEAHEAELLAAHYHPYAARVSELVDARLAATGRAVILDVHSYPREALPYELHGTAPRPAICLGTDPAHTPDWLREAARQAFSACGSIGLDTPFAGCYVPLKHYGTEPAVAALMLEIRRDTYADAAGADRVAAALARLIDTIG
jgi:N-formylglutamate deformylase